MRRTIQYPIQNKQNQNYKFFIFSYKIKAIYCYLFTLHSICFSLYIMMWFFQNIFRKKFLQHIIFRQYAILRNPYKIYNFILNSCARSVYSKRRKCIFVLVCNLLVDDKGWTNRNKVKRLEPTINWTNNREKESEISISWARVYIVSGVFTVCGKLMIVFVCHFDINVYISNYISLYYVQIQSRWVNENFSSF